MTELNTPLVAALDVGTTTIRCHIINSSAQIVGSSKSLVSLLYPQPGFVEIDPGQLWQQVTQVLKAAIKDANATVQDIKALGISTQRSTMMTWSRDKGTPYHNFITWKDMRSKDLCNELNTSKALKGFRWGIYSIFLATRNQRYLTGSRLKISPNHVTGRLLWVLENIPNMKHEIANHNVMFGTVDTWLLYKFSQGKLHVTDVSNASATALFDPYVQDWGSWAKHILGIPLDIMPKVVSNDFDFGATSAEILGAEVPIRCVMGDQSSSMFASACLNCDSIKATLGTGAFLDVNTGSEIHNSVTGIYPLIAWKFGKDKVTNLGEVACNDCGSLIQWLLNMGFVENAADTCNIALGISDTDGVYFVPAFSGLGPPINDMTAASGFLGIKPSTTKQHLVRAVLESIVYRLVLAFDTLKKERNRDYRTVKVDGGVSSNDFICQLLADLGDLRVERFDSIELSVWGVGFVAGMSAGFWNKNQLKDLRKIEKVFEPTSDELYKERCLNNFNQWLNATKRFRHWYEES